MNQTTLTFTSSIGGAEIDLKKVSIPGFAERVKDVVATVSLQGEVCSVTTVLASAGDQKIVREVCRIVRERGVKTYVPYIFYFQFKGSSYMAVPYGLLNQGQEETAGGNSIWVFKTV